MDRFELFSSFDFNFQPPKCWHEYRFNGLQIAKVCDNSRRTIDKIIDRSVIYELVYREWLDVTQLNIESKLN